MVVPLAEVQLTCGRLIELVSLDVSLTYGGLLEGLPTMRTNDRKLARMVDTAGRRHGGWPVYVVSPDRRVLASHTIRGEPHEALPTVTFAGLFTSTALEVAGPSTTQSLLTIVWFGTDLAAMFSGESVARLRVVPWAEHARDGKD